MLRKIFISKPSPDKRSKGQYCFFVQQHLEPIKFHPTKSDSLLCECLKDQTRIVTKHKLLGNIITGAFSRLQSILFWRVYRKHGAFCQSIQMTCTCNYSLTVPILMKLNDCSIRPEDVHEGGILIQTISREIISNVRQGYPFGDLTHSSGYH